MFGVHHFSFLFDLACSASRRPLVRFLYLPYLDLLLPPVPADSLTESPRQARGMLGWSIRRQGIVHVVVVFLAIFLSTEEATIRYAIPCSRLVSHVSFVVAVLPATFALLSRANAIPNVFGTRTALCVCRKLQTTLLLLVGTISDPAP